MEQSALNKSMVLKLRNNVKEAQKFKFKVLKWGKMRFYLQNMEHGALNKTMVLKFKILFMRRKNSNLNFQNGDK